MEISEITLIRVELSLLLINRRIKVFAGMIIVNARSNVNGVNKSFDVISENKNPEKINTIANCNMLQKALPIKENVSKIFLNNE